MSLLHEAMRLVWITDGRADAPRIVRIVTAAVAGGLRAVQIREPELSARELWRLCEHLRGLLEPQIGILIVNDRIEVAVAGLADGVHLGSQSMPWDRARGILPAESILGCSAHDAKELESAVAAGADYASLSPVLETSCKPGVAALGVDRAADLSRACPIPVLWLGGFDADQIRSLEAVPFGVAVMSALGSAEDVCRTAESLCASISHSGSGSVQ